MIQRCALRVSLAALFIVTADTGVVIIGGFFTGSGRLKGNVGRLIISMGSFITTCIAPVFTSVVMSAANGILCPSGRPIMLQRTALGIGLAILGMMAANTRIIVICGRLTGGGGFEDSVGHLVVDVKRLVTTITASLPAGVVVSALDGIS